jgi:hypothetical protein
VKKISTVAMHGNENFRELKLAVGLDLGDLASHYCILDEAGNVILEHSLPTTPKGIHEVFSGIPRSRTALETGTHSPWVSRQLTQLGHEVIVAHARNVRLIGESSRKDDQLDAQSANPSDGDPRSRGARVAFTSAVRVLTRTDEILWRAAKEVWHRANESRDRQGTEPGVARCLGSTVGGN